MQAYHVMCKHVWNYWTLLLYICNGMVDFCYCSIVSFIPTFYRIFYRFRKISSNYVCTSVQLVMRKACFRGFCMHAYIVMCKHVWNCWTLCYILYVHTHIWLICNISFISTFLWFFYRFWKLHMVQLVIPYVLTYIYALGHEVSSIHYASEGTILHHNIVCKLLNPACLHIEIEAIMVHWIQSSA